jgi:hypothetical protein
MEPQVTRLEELKFEVDLTDRAGVENPLDGADRRGVHECVPPHQDPLSLRGSFGKVVGDLIRRQRLRYERMLPRLERLGGQFVVRMWRHRSHG